MTKVTATKKLKKMPPTEGDMSEYDPSIFEIRDRHYGSLFAVKKKIRACEKKIRELEQSASPPQRSQNEAHNSSKKSTPNQVESKEAKIERLSKIELKKIQLSLWKEAALCIHSARKDEITQGITNVCMADVVDGVDLLKQVLANDDKWPHYKCPNKKHLQKVDIERIRQLAHYLNIHVSSTQSGSSKPANLNSFTSVVDYLNSPIAIGQECPMSFSEFVRLFDKLRKTLSVEIVVKEPDAVTGATVASAVNNDDGDDDDAVAAVAALKIEATDNDAANGDKPENQKTNKNRARRSPKNQKSGRKSQNGTSSSGPTQNNDGSNKSNVAASTHSSLPTIPEKLVVVVTSNAKNRQQEGLSNSTTITPPATSQDDMPKSNASVAPTSETKTEANGNSNREVPSGRLIHNPNVPTDDSDEEGWLAPASAKQKKPVVESQNYRQSQNASKRGGNVVGNRGGSRNGNSRGGNNNNRKGSNPPRSNNGDANNAGNFRNKRPQHMNKSAISAAVIQSESQY